MNIILISFNFLKILVHQLVKRESFTAAQQKFQNDMQTAHNTYRKNHCASPLTIDNTICESAQSYADQLAATNTFKHSGGSYGENLYMMSSSNKIKSVDGETNIRTSFIYY